MNILKKWWFWLVIVFIVILVFFFVGFKPLGYENLSLNQCNAVHDSLELELQIANHCETDSDCKVLPLGGKYIEFGCYHYINKNVDGDRLYQKMDAHWKRCNQIIDKCASAPEPKCENGKCVEKA